MPITELAQEILVERVKEEGDGRVLPRGKYQVFRDGVPIAGLGGSCVGRATRRQFGDNASGSKAAMRHSRRRKSTTINYPNTGRRPALKLTKPTNGPISSSSRQRHNHHRLSSSAPLANAQADIEDRRPQVSLPS